MTRCFSSVLHQWLGPHTASFVCPSGFSPLFSATLPQSFARPSPPSPNTSSVDLTAHRCAVLTAEAAAPPLADCPAVASVTPERRYVPISIRRSCLCSSPARQPGAVVHLTGCLFALLPTATHPSPPPPSPPPPFHLGVNNKAPLSWGYSSSSAGLYLYRTEPRFTLR